MNKKLTASLLLICTTLFLAESVWADEIWNFTRITCIPELNYFEASNVEINSGSNEESKFMGDNQEQIRKKYNLRGESLRDVQECKLKDANLKIQIKYRDIKAGGACAAAPDATLKLWIDDKLVVDLDSFNYCHPKTITGVGLKIFNKGWNHESILYFKERDGIGEERNCGIWLDDERKNISPDYSNDCNDSKKNKSLPITNDYITKIRTTNNKN